MRRRWRTNYQTAASGIPLNDIVVIHCARHNDCDNDELKRLVAIGAAPLAVPQELLFLAALVSGRRQAIQQTGTFLLYHV